MSLEDNKQMAKRYLLELYGRWKFELIDELIHDDYELSENSVTIKHQASNKNGKQGFVKRLKQFKNAIIVTPVSTAK